MRWLWIGLLYSVVCVQVSEASMFNIFNWFSRTASWEFVQSVGGMAVGQPVRRSPEKVFLPVRCDVSGASTISVKPTAMNSGLVVRKITARVEGREILLSLKTGTPTAEHPSAQCGEVELASTRMGDYQVFYVGSDGEKHLLSTVTISENLEPKLDRAHLRLHDNPAGSSKPRDLGSLIIEQNGNVEAEPTQASFAPFLEELVESINKNGFVRIPAAAPRGENPHANVSKIIQCTDPDFAEALSVYLKHSRGITAELQ